MITRRDVADLRVGDVVELSDDRWEGTVMRGPLVEWKGRLILGVVGVSSLDADRRFIVRREDGAASVHADHRTLTVISRAPRSVYSNVHKPGPSIGDVARTLSGKVVVYVQGPAGGYWMRANSSRAVGDVALPQLLIDGDTGRVVWP